MNRDLGSIDPNIKLPKGVLAAAARADQLMAPPKEGAEAEAAERAAPPVTTEGVPAEPSGVDAGQELQPAEAQARLPEHPAEPKGGYEHAYNSMKGRYEAADRINRDLRSQVAGLSSELANLRATVAQLQTAKPAPSEMKFDRLVTAEEEQDYGPELLSVIERKAREVVQPLIKQVSDDFGSVQRKVDGIQTVTQKSAREKLFDTLDREVPDWSEMNNNPQFVQWLADVDPYSGQVRHDMLDNAFEENNVNRVMSFFKGFLREEATVAPRASQPTPGTESSGKVPLESFAAPGRAKSAAPAKSPAEKPIITRAQIARFYTDLSNGKYRGYEDKASAFEKQIFEAQAEGRIQ